MTRTNHLNAAVQTLLNFKYTSDSRHNVQHKYSVMNQPLLQIFSWLLAHLYCYLRSWETQGQFLYSPSIFITVVQVMDLLLLWPHQEIWPFLWFEVLITHNLQLFHLFHVFFFTAITPSLSHKMRNMLQLPPVHCSLLGIVPCQNGRSYWVLPTSGVKSYKNSVRELIHKHNDHKLWMVRNTALVINCDWSQKCKHNHN